MASQSVWQNWQRNMLELVAQGKLAQHRWRKLLLQKLPFVVGRTSDHWAVGWDEKISRKHARLRLVENVLTIEKLADAANPIFYKGTAEESFSVNPGEHFVIGDTTFLFTNDSAFATLEQPSPISQRAFTSDYLRQVRYRDADRRIEMLNRLPEIISSSNDEEVLHGQMVNLLLSGISSASAVAICRNDDNGKLQVVKWDQRNLGGGDFRPCARLVEQALNRRESTLHLWQATDASADFTVDLVNDWAFVCPLSGASSVGWSIYVAGVNRVLNHSHEFESEEPDLQGDVKFTELVGATLANLRRVQYLERRQSTFRPFFSPVVIEAFADRDPEEVLKPRQCRISVLFCDLRGFSAKSEQMSDQLEELLDRVSQALGIMTKTVLDFGGVIGDFHGDSAMGFWGWPLSRQDAAENACRAALKIQSELASIAEQPEHRLHDFQMGIGVATGNAVAGKIGTSHQVKVTAFGPVVNLAARLEGMTRILNIPILVDKYTIERAGSAFAGIDFIAGTRKLGRFRPFGLNIASEVHQLFPAGNQPEILALDRYQSALSQFESGQWIQARETLALIVEVDAAAKFLSRFISSREVPAGFNGVIDLSSK